LNRSERPRILVTGGGTFLGDAIAAALLAEGADVTLLVRPGAEKRLGGLAQRVRWYVTDVWEPSSLRGRARGVTSVIHTVGSMTADPAQGLTFHYLNFVSARNVANMCVSSGVQHMVLLSSPRAPYAPAEYIRAKREAEQYLTRIGLRATIIRTPLVYVRGGSRPLPYRILSALGGIPPLSWLGLRRITPLPVDIVARGTARITLAPLYLRTLYTAGDLRRHNTRRERRLGMAEDSLMASAMREVSPIELLDDEVPFGWQPQDGRV
jgi:uncharacterized protein YbjT (DUF2867 family)